MSGRSYETTPVPYNCLYAPPKRVTQVKYDLKGVLYYRLYIYNAFFSHAATAAIWPGPPHYRGYNITFRDTTLGRTPPDG